MIDPGNQSVINPNLGVLLILTMRTYCHQWFERFYDLEKKKYGNHWLEDSSFTVEFW